MKDKDILQDSEVFHASVSLMDHAAPTIDAFVAHRPGYRFNKDERLAQRIADAWDAQTQRLANAWRDLPSGSVSRTASVDGRVS